MIRHEDIAKAAGVSRSKVSRALSGDFRNIKIDEAKRIIAIAENMGCFGRNRLARSIRTGKSCLLGCLICDLTNPFYSEMIVGIEEVATRNDYIVIISDSSLSTDLMKKLVEYQLDGLILTVSPNEETDYIKRFVQGRFPVVTTFDGVISDIACSVRVDHDAAAYALTNYLLDLGHRYIAYSSDGVPFDARTRGYLRALQERNIVPKDELILKEPAKSTTYEAGYKRGLYLADSDDPPTAVIAYNDIEACGMISALRDRGLKIPDDISVCGFDGIRMGSLLTPRLTTIETPNRRWGQRLAELLISALNGEPVESEELDWKLKIGGTSARPKN